MKRLIPIVQHALTLVAGIILTLLALPFVSPLLPDDEPTVLPTPIPDVVIPMTLSEQEAILGNLYENIAPSVVSISLGIRFEDEFLYTSLSGGSGFVIDAEGHIVTNAHVLSLPPDVVAFIEEEEIAIDDIRFEVSMFDGTITDAELIGADPDSDIAVLQIDVDSSRLRPTTFANSDSLRVGQTVLAIGNPFSNDWTLTTGIISALNRSIAGLQGFSIGGVIQTDTAINPGNSGGPLLNLDGEVVGVNSQINTENGSNSGIGFAVPSNLVSKVARLLIEDGVVEYGFIGIQSRPVDLDLINVFELPDNLRGVTVREVIPDTPAAEAGLQTLSADSVDIITALDGNPVADFDELIGYLAINTVPGDTVMLTVYRDGDFLEIPLTLTNRPTAEVNEPEQESENEQDDAEDESDTSDQETDETNQD